MNTVLALLIIAGLVSVVGGFVKWQKSKKAAASGSGGSSRDSGPRPRQR